MAKAEPNKYLEDGKIEGQQVSYGGEVSTDPGSRYAFVQGAYPDYIEVYRVREDGSYSYWGATSKANAATNYGYTEYTPTAEEAAHYGGIYQQTMQGAGTPAPGTQGTPPTSSGGQANQAAQQTDAEFNTWLNSQNLSEDQKNAIRAVYDSVSVNDAARAKQVTEAMAAAAEYSDPYFKAQMALVADNLARNFQSADGDLAFQSQQLQSSLQKLRDDVDASKSHMSFQHVQELKALERKYETDIENTQNAMAATGFTNSTRRAKTEGLITDTFGDAVESSNRQLAYQVGNLDRQLTFQQQDTAAQIANLQRLTAEGKIDALRSAEQQVGSQHLQQLGYTGLVGGVGGQIPREQIADMTSFAGAQVF